MNYQQSWVTLKVASARRRQFVIAQAQRVLTGSQDDDRLTWKEIVALAVIVILGSFTAV
jgi:hypothetical protein